MSTEFNILLGKSVAVQVVTLEYPPGIPPEFHHPLRGGSYTQSESSASLNITKSNSPAPLKKSSLVSKALALANNSQLPSDGEIRRLATVHSHENN